MLLVILLIAAGLLILWVDNRTPLTNGTLVGILILLAALYLLVQHYA